MWYPLVGSDPLKPDGHALVDVGRYRFVHVIEDIQSLNERAEQAELEITAISLHQYPYVSKQYALTGCGCSMGDNYGPLVVVPRGSRIHATGDLSDPKITLAVPGERTTAFLALSLLLGKGRFQYKVVPFDQIIQAVKDGAYDAGLIIHEGQLTFQDSGLDALVDLGEWWTRTRKLPLPLGANAIRRDLGPEMGHICRILCNSIKYALEHRDQALTHAMQYARDMGKNLADQFVGMYVNQWTLDYGDTGRKAVQQLLHEARDADLVPDFGEIDFIEPA
jgi:1,4-dihydroxy-6-naphthoate synthase